MGPADARNEGTNERQVPAASRGRERRRASHERAPIERARDKFDARPKCHMAAQDD